MIVSLLITYNHDRMSSITRVLHTTTWKYFTSHLPDRFIRSPKVVKEAIMTDINELVQEFRRTSSDEFVGVFMRRPLGLLQGRSWKYFTSHLPDRFTRSPKVAKEAIMTDDINDLVQEFWRTSSDESVGVFFFAMRRLLGILQGCSEILAVCFDIISFFGELPST